MGMNDPFRNLPGTLQCDLSEERLLKLQKAMFQNQIELSKSGVDADELPNGYGEFGLTLSNPIPCQFIMGGRLYLDRLRVSDGTKIRYLRIGSFFSEVTPHPIDGYLLSHPNGTTLATIYISAYQKRNSSKSPKGFYLASTPFS
ncbi:MAG: hypothetical protein KA902_04015 [Arenimonas sp.]|nr:hypothetical protein [Arenimonas sp.]